MSTSSPSDDSSNRFYGGSIDDSLTDQAQQQLEATFIETGRRGFAIARRHKFSPDDDDDDDDRLVLLSEQEFGKINSSSLATEFVSAEAVDEDIEKVPSSKKVVKFAAVAAPPAVNKAPKKTSTTSEGSKKGCFSCGRIVIAVIIVALIAFLVFAVLELTSPKASNVTNNQALNNNSNTNNNGSEDGSSEKELEPDTSVMGGEPTLAPTSSILSTNVPTKIQTVAPTEIPGVKVLYGDIAYFELMYDDDNDETIKDQMNISSLWLSGGRGKYSNLVMTRDLIHDSNEQNKTQGYYEWILRSDVTDNGNRLQQDPKDGECVKYGDNIWLQVNRPAHRWISGGRGGPSLNHSEVTTHDVVYDTTESWVSYQYRWTVRSNHVILDSGGSQDFSANWQPQKDPKHGQCITYTDVLYLQVWWKPTHWLTGGRQYENITHYPPIGSRPREQVYSKNINQMEELDNNDLYQWMIHNCALDC